VNLRHKIKKVGFSRRNEKAEIQRMDGLAINDFLTRNSIKEREKIRPRLAIDFEKGRRGQGKSK